MAGSATTLERRLGGAALPSQDVTDAIRDATFELLAEVGYGRLSIEAIAKRAAVSKTAIYRRWASVEALVADLAVAAAITATEIPNTGTLLDDLRAFLQIGYEILSHPRVGVILPDLLAEAARNPRIAEIYNTQVRDPRRALVAQIIRRAIARGELDDDIDVESALDMIVGALYWRVAVVRIPVDDQYLERLAHAIHAALSAPLARSSGATGGAWT